MTTNDKDPKDIEADNSEEQTSRWGEWCEVSGEWTGMVGQWKNCSGEWTDCSGEWHDCSGEWTNSNGEWSRCAGEWSGQYRPTESADDETDEDEGEH